MLLRSVEYARPGSVEEALELLAANPDARALAGGQTLVNVMKARIAAPEVLIDLNDLPELREIRETGDGLELGRDGHVLAARHRLRGRTARGRSSPTWPRRSPTSRCGTAAPSAATSARTTRPTIFRRSSSRWARRWSIAGAGGEREVAAQDFFLGVYMTVVGPGELLTRVKVPPRGSGDGFAAVTIGADGTCIVNAAAAANGGPPRVAIGCVDAVPVLVEPTGADEEAVREAVRGAALDPPGDVHASADYRRHLAEVLALRAVRQATEGA